MTGNPTPHATRHDPDGRKGAIEGDRPGDEQIGNPHGNGVDDAGWPSQQWVKDGKEIGKVDLVAEKPVAVPYTKIP